MDNKIELQVKIDRAKEDLKAIQDAGGFKGQAGSIKLNKIQSLLATIDKDTSKLDKKGWDKYFKDVEQLNHLIQSAGRHLSSYSKEYLQQAEKVEAAKKKVLEAQDKETEALEKQKEAIQKIQKSKALYYNKNTGRQVKDAGTISSLYSNNQLEIRDHNKEIMKPGAALDAVKTNLDQLVSADKAVEVAQQNVKVAKADLTAEKLTLESTPTGGAANPITTRTDAHAEDLFSYVSTMREGQNKQDAFENATTEVDSKAIEKQTSSLGKAFKQFTLYAIAVRNAKRALNEAKKTIIDLDKYLTEQAMVTGRTRQQTYALLKEYQNLAKELGTTTKEVAEVATQYMRQGKTAADAITLTRAAVSAAKVAGISASESVTYLTTALNGFQLSANDAMLVSDKFAAIAAQSASSYEELAIALSKVASQANLAGMSIDYTTALLAKGLETTREAPETIGTALKTVIARMREMGDYGETLEGDTDINNVETQLAYVNIELKNQNGELRSTEEVLDQLGKKWDTLTVNQQAAVAKALAGTRQQSRLIAMMQDYERVTELQEISQRSTGATIAQMETYLQGMDAALNKLNNAWEQIVTNLTNSDAIINIINIATNFLNQLAAFLSTDFGVIATLTTVSVLGLNILGQKIAEQRIARENNKIQQQINLAKLKEAKAESDIVLTEKQAKLQAQGKLVTNLKNLKAIIEQKKTQGIATAGDEQRLAIVNKDLAVEQTKLNTMQQEYDLEAAKNKSLEDQIGLQQMQTSNALSLTGALSGVLAILGSIFAIYKGMALAIGLVIKLKNKETRATMKAAIAEKLKAAFGMADSASAIPATGWIIAAGILATMAGIAIATAVANKNSAQNTTEQINELSASIYNLQKTANTIKTIESKFDALDNKVIKTNKDLEEMNELLASASDSMSTEVDYTSIAEKTGWTENRAKRVYDRARKKKDSGKTLTKNEQAALDAQGFGGLTEKEYYDSLSDSDKRAHLAEKQKELEEKLDKARKEQLDLINKEADKEKYKAEVTALTNAEIYKQIDALKGLSDESKKATEQVAEALTNELSATEQLKYLNSPDKLKGLINRIADTGMTEALTSDSATLSEKVEAYRKITAQLTSEELGAFNVVYRNLADLVQIINNSNGAILTYIEKLNISSEKINDLHEALGDKYLGILESLTAYTDVETGVVDLQEVIKANFGNLEKDSEEYKKVLLALEKTIGESMLNIGQSITKTSNQINAVYETAQKWSTMSAADQGSFLSENSELFKNNSYLYQAFQTGDLSKIEKALSQSEALQKDVQERIKIINSQLAIEEARSEKDRNEFMIQYLKDQLNMLQDEENFYKASLDIRIDLEKKQLDIYKEYLQKQQDALTDALEKRKDAYQEYFDAINQEEEDEEYEKQANLLATNLSKLASSDNATSKQQTKELEKQLQNLEEERLEELRQRAQEAVLQNLDDQVEEINKKFDKLLESNQNLLAAMLNDESNKDDFIANMISSNIEGMTANEAQKWLSEDFTTTFGSMLPKEALTQIEKSMSEVLNLNVNGGNIMISEQQQKNLYKIIMDALQQIGYN